MATWLGDRDERGIERSGDHRERFLPCPVEADVPRPSFIGSSPLRPRTPSGPSIPRISAAGAEISTARVRGAIYRRMADVVAPRDFDQRLAGLAPLERLFSAGVHGNAILKAATSPQIWLSDPSAHPGLVQFPSPINA